MNKSFSHRMIVIIVQDRPVEQLGHPAVLLRGVVRDDHVTAGHELTIIIYSSVIRIIRQTVTHPQSECSEVNDQVVTEAEVKDTLFRCRDDGLLGC